MSQIDTISVKKGGIAGESRALFSCLVVLCDNQKILIYGLQPLGERAIPSRSLEKGLHETSRDAVS